MSLSISLVMPTLNSEAFIFEALRSVQVQDFSSNVQVVIADGGSSDSTLEIAREFSFAKILEGPDAGIYHGFNRGIAAAEGDIVGFLNSDDLLPPGTLSAVARLFKSEHRIDIVSGGAGFARSDEIGDSDGGVTLFNETKLSVASIMFGVPAINARYFRADALRQIGGFSTEAGLAADREFVLKIYNSQLHRVKLKRSIYQYRVHAGSATIAGDDTGKQRVWDAEITLSNYVIGEYSKDKQVVSISTQAQLLAHTKQKLARLFEGEISKNTAFGKPELRIGDLAKLPTALWNWRKWRGILSGY